MDRRVLTILYEDRRVPVQPFGLHRFVMACVFDAAKETESLRNNVHHQAMNGNGSLRASCKNVSSISRDGHPVIAVFDNDEVRRLLGLPWSADASTVKATLLKEKSCNTPLTIVLLEQNTESVIKAAKSCDSRNSLDPATMERALRKIPSDRDLIFNAAATLRYHALRACVTRSNASFSELVEHATTILKAQLSPPTVH